MKLTETWKLSGGVIVLLLLDHIAAWDHRPVWSALWLIGACVCFWHDNRDNLRVESE